MVESEMSEAVEAPAPGAPAKRMRRRDLPAMANQYGVPDESELLGEDEESEEEEGWGGEEEDGEGPRGRGRGRGG